METRVMVQRTKFSWNDEVHFKNKTYGVHIIKTIRMDSGTSLFQYYLYNPKSKMSFWAKEIDIVAIDKP
jgi:hypothetical protein